MHINFLCFNLLFFVALEEWKRNKLKKKNISVIASAGGMNHIQQICLG